MTDRVIADICVIGAGSAGLTVAAGASQLGAKTVLIEANKMGGDCLNYGCVPSKALLAAGHAARAVGGGAAFGIAGGPVEVDFRRVHDHVHAVIEAVAPQDSVERFEGLGVQVIRARARFIGPRELIAGDIRVRARRFVVATGSGPAVPPIPGLDRVPSYTNETIFDLTERPDHLVVIGGGPIGCELAQAHRQLGARVTILEAGHILPKDDPELVELLRQRLRADGIEIHEKTKVTGVEGVAGAVTVRIEANGRGEAIQGTAQGTALLVATGRKPTVKGLDLEAAGVAYTERGITVDRRLRTTNPRIFAIGDVTGGYQFTHMAGYDAGIVIRNALFRLPTKVDHQAVPWVTYTAPELAHVGLTERQAREDGRGIRILRWPFAENDRAQAERVTDGLIKVVTTPRGRILGASILGAHAGELIQPWILAIGQKLKIGAIANMIAPYPTLGEVSKRAAGSFYAPTLFSERTRRLVRFLQLFG